MNHLQLKSFLSENYERLRMRFGLLTLIGFLSVLPLFTYSAAPDYGAKMYSFAVVSDIHIMWEKTEGGGPYSYDGDRNCRGGIDDWKRTLKIMEVLKPDFLTFSGDIGISSKESELILYQRTVKRWAKVPVHGCNGNHDAGHSDEMWKKYTGFDKSYVFTHHDDVFMFMSIDQGSLSSNRDTRVYYSNSLEWLKQTLETYKGRRIFLHMHIPLPNTSGVPIGTPYGYSANGNDAELKQIMSYLREADNVVVLTGHTHYRFEAEENADYLTMKQIDNTNCYSVHVPSNNCPREWATNDIWREGYTDNSTSQGFWVDVYEKGVIFRGMDFAKADIGERMLYGDKTYVMEKNLYMPLDTVPDKNIDTITAPTAMKCYLPDYQYYLPIPNSNVKPDNFVELDRTSISVADGAPASFSVHLGVEGGTVQLASASSDLIISPSTLTFTDANYRTDQTVTVSVPSGVSGGSANITVSLDGEEKKVVTVKIVTPMDETRLVPLDYIVVKDGAYWNTEYVPQPSTAVEMKAWIDNNSREWFGCMNDSEYNGSNFCFHYNSQGYMQPRLGTAYSGYKNTVNLKGAPHVIKMDNPNKKSFVDGTLIEDANSANYNSPNGIEMGICSFNFNGTFDSQRQEKYWWNNEKLYYVKIWENDELVREYVPVRNLDDSKLYLYDKVEKKLYANPMGSVTDSSGNY